MKHFVLAYTLLASTFFSNAVFAADMQKRAEELKSLHWGMFICWSFSTFSGHEWSRNVNNVNFFKATEVDTDQWARTAKEAGMGYILFLTKHHDGFCLWDTKTTDFKVTKSPLGKDVLAELKKSCDKHGIKLALYFSEADWNWPNATDGKDGDPKGEKTNPEMKKAQLKELLTQYGPIEYIWFDRAAGNGGFGHPETFEWCKSFQPECFIGFNHGEPSDADIKLGEMGNPAPVPEGSKYLLAEFTYPILPPHQGGANWFYSLPKHDNLVRPASRLYRDYLGAVKFGNLFSIDIGPNYVGRIRDIDVKTLREVGELIRGEKTLEKPLSEGKKATASSSWHGDADYDASRAFDGSFSSRWAAANGSRNGWIEIDLGEETAISRILIDESSFPRTTSWSLEIRKEDGWRKTVADGEKLGADKEIAFEKPIMSRYFRLCIHSASEVPTINEIQLFP